MPIPEIVTNRIKPAANTQPIVSFRDLLSAEKRPFLVVLVLAVLINIAGIGTRFFTNDPGLYGLLAKTMVQNHNYTDLMYRGVDWLDKPHFPFWMTALSFNLFGFTTFAYKLPALFFYFMSVVYTFKFTKRLYDFETALIAAIILLTSQHVIMSNTDVRAEPYIMGLLMGSVYHFYRLKELFGWADLLLASLFATCAVMTKGIYLLIPIGAAIIGDYIFKKDYKGLLQWRWLLAVMLVAIFVLPEIYTLYIQFDLHPEKTVFNHKGVSGIHWFLWDSQFGRFNNSGYITRPDRDYFFFVHTLLWAFAPWAFLMYYALFLKIKNIVKGIAMPEYVAVSGAVLMFLIFSVSQFQLPFYTNILFPFFAIITAGYVKYVFVQNHGRYYTFIQNVVIITLSLLVAALFFCFYTPFPLTGYLIGLCSFFGLFISYVLRKYRGVRAVFLLTCGVIITVNTYLVTEVYRVLLIYRGDVNAALYINEHVQTDKQIVATFEVPDPFEFYTKRKVKFSNLDAVTTSKNKNQLVLVEDTLMAHLVKQHTPFKVVQKFDNYPNEVITKPFIFYKERDQTLNHYFLIEL